MPIINEVIEEILAKLADKRLESLRLNFFKYILYGLGISLVFFIFTKYYFPHELSRVGGLLVGIAISIDIFAHWLQLNPIKKDSDINALIAITISGTIAVFGTLLWTFGDLL